ncbi:MAG: hypothetical protein QGI60_04790, partial [archaeon]|nr:hypothetical protein [archaeon]
MEREVKDKSLLNEFVKDFLAVVDRNKLKYAVVSGFVVISHGRARGTEDIDLIIERISLESFDRLHGDLVEAGFECLQGTVAKDLFNDYLEDNLSLR